MEITFKQNTKIYYTDIIDENTEDMEVSKITFTNDANLIGNTSDIVSARNAKPVNIRVRDVKWVLY